MDRKRVSVAVAVGLVVVLTLATGPFGPLDISAADETPTPGSGSADVTIVSAPDGATITSAQHGADGFYLQVPAVVMDVENLEGNPVLEYTLTIDELGYARSTVHFLADGGEGRQSIVLERDFLERDFDRDTYDAQLELTLRGEREIVLLDETVTVTVDR